MAMRGAVVASISTLVPVPRRRGAWECRAAIDPWAALVARAHVPRAWARHARLVRLHQRLSGGLAATLTAIEAIRRRGARERRTAIDPWAALVARAHVPRAWAWHV